MLAQTRPGGERPTYRLFERTLPRPDLSVIILMTIHGSHRPLDDATSPLLSTPPSSSYKESKRQEVYHCYFPTTEESSAITIGQVCMTHPLMRINRLNDPLAATLHHSASLITTSRGGADLDKTARRAASARCDRVLAGYIPRRGGRR